MKKYFLPTLGVILATVFIIELARGLRQAWGNGLWICLLLISTLPLILCSVSLVFSHYGAGARHFVGGIIGLASLVTATVSLPFVFAGGYGLLWGMILVPAVLILIGAVGFYRGAAWASIVLRVVVALLFLLSWREPFSRYFAGQRFCVISGENLNLFAHWVCESSYTIIFHSISVLLLAVTFLPRQAK